MSYLSAESGYLSKLNAIQSHLSAYIQFEIAILLREDNFLLTFSRFCQAKQRNSLPPFLVVMLQFEALKTGARLQSEDGKFRFSIAPELQNRFWVAEFVGKPTDSMLLECLATGTREMASAKQARLLMVLTEMLGEFDLIREPILNEVLRAIQLGLRRVAILAARSIDTQISTLQIVSAVPANVPIEIRSFMDLGAAEAWLTETT